MQTTYRRTNDQSALVLCGNNMQLFQRDRRLAQLGGGVGVSLWVMATDAIYSK